MWVKIEYNVLCVCDKEKNSIFSDDILFDRQQLVTSVFELESFNLISGSCCKTITTLDSANIY